jgi:hypothetical protein
LDFTERALRGVAVVERGVDEMLLDSFLTHAMREVERGEENVGDRSDEGIKITDTGQALRESMLFEPHTHNIIAVDPDTISRLSTANGRTLGGEKDEAMLDISVTRVSIDTTAPARSLFVCAEARGTA